MTATRLQPILKCPKCGGNAVRLEEFPPDRTNLYCQNRGNCGWMAWVDIGFGDSAKLVQLKCGTDEAILKSRIN